MSDRLYNEMSTQISIPELVTHNMIIGETNSGIGKYLSTKQIIQLSEGETNDLIHMIDNGEIDIGNYLSSLYIDYEYTDEDDKMYSNLEDGYNVSEFFSGYDMYIPKRRYFNYIFTHPNSIGVFNIYNGKSANMPIDIIKSKISPLGRDSIPGNFNFPVIRKIKYTTFKSTLYLKKNRVNSYPLSFPAMCVNLPYSYYSKQYIPENIYTYDIDTKKYSFAGMDEDTFTDYFKDICENGIRRSVFIQIRNGRIISASNEDYLILLIASYLKLPTIPVVIYMMNNNQMNNLLISDRVSDIAVNTNHYIREPAPKDMIDNINKVCENNLIYFNTSYHGDIKSYGIKINGKEFNQFNYMPNIPISETPSEKISYVDLYRKSDICETEGIPIEDIDANNKMLAEAAKAEFDELIDKKIQELEQIIQNNNS